MKAIRRKTPNSEIRRRIKHLTSRKAKSKVHIEVIPEHCTACGLCAKFCPSGSWEMEGHMAAWKYGMKFCLECGTCYQLCQAGAIRWSYPKGGEGVVYHSG